MLNERNIMRGLIILAVLYFAFGYAKELIYEARAETVSEAAERAKKEAKAEYDTKIDALKAELKSVKDIRSAVRVETRYQPMLVPAAEVKRADLPKELALPDSPGFTIRSEAQEVAIGKLALDFETCKAGVTLCEKEKAQLILERDEWKKAAKGGSKWKRFVSGATKIGIGLGVGYALGRSR